MWGEDVTMKNALLIAALVALPSMGLAGTITDTGATLSGGGWVQAMKIEGGEGTATITSAAFLKGRDLAGNVQVVDLNLNDISAVEAWAEAKFGGTFTYQPDRNNERN